MTKILAYLYDADGNATFVPFDNISSIKVGDGEYMVKLSDRPKDFPIKVVHIKYVEIKTEYQTGYHQFK